MEVAAQGNRGLAKLLLDHGADVHLTDPFGLSPLHFAVLGGNLDVVDLMVSRGADVHLKANLGFTPLHESANKGQCDILRFLLEHGARVDEASDEGLTPLHLAVNAGSGAAVRTLLDAGADPSARDVNGATPVDGAVASGSLEVLAVLSGALGRPDLMQHVTEDGARQGGPQDDFSADLESVPAPTPHSRATIFLTVLAFAALIVGGLVIFLAPSVISSLLWGSGSAASLTAGAILLTAYVKAIYSWGRRNDPNIRQ